MRKRLPIGIEDFKEMREKDYYYVDKSLLIREILDNASKVILFTRPRRFGKTLGLSMLKYFFEYEPGRGEEGTGNRQLFERLKIMDEGEAYTGRMGGFPVISLSLKSAKQADFKTAFLMLRHQIADEYRRHIYVCDDLREADRERFLSILDEKAEDAGFYDAAAFLSRVLYTVTGKKTVLLLDEYDVPLENAYFRGFYDQMLNFIKSLFESALKTNPYLEFAVVTGCLRISRESIFTGLNNLEIISVLNRNFSEHFGFTGHEVEDMLDFYHIRNKKDEIREWYDGYLFGDTDVYNPWSVINYVKSQVIYPDAFPRAWWANTSSNDIVRALVDRADADARHELENLISKGTVEKPVHEDITYGEIEQSQDNLWNFLLFTGYLTKVSERFSEGVLYLTMAIPNEELRYIFRNTVLEWFEQKVRQKDFTAFYKALLTGDTETMERVIGENLMETVSFYDYREAYYHGFLAGLLKQMDGYLVKSNREGGLGRSDIVICSAPYYGIAVILEIKTADSFAGLCGKAGEALSQIRERRYEEDLRRDGYHTFIRYGIAFYKKLCRITADQDSVIY